MNQLPMKKYSIDQFAEMAAEERDSFLEIIARADHPSTYEDFDSFRLMVFRRMWMNDNSLSLTSEAFIIFQNSVFQLDRSHNEFFLLPENIQDLANKLEKYYAGNKRILEGYSSELEKLETSLFDRKVPSYFMDVWFDLKKDVTIAENFYLRNRLMFKEFTRRERNFLQEYAEWFHDLEETIIFQQSSLQALESRLDGLHHYYSSIKSEKLNRTIITLTVISGIFLPLNLVVGFFGMNTEGLFFKDNPQGTQIVTGILAGILFVIFFGIPLLNFIDRWVLRFLLGRYNMYRNIFNRVKDFDNRIKNK